ncbi:MAG: class I SAM-dependent methyltransferase [Magnetovibrio sp.]|nr:class I SAM-dependent methyltransferase [Magnetovibrio sp.]
MANKLPDNIPDLLDYIRRVYDHQINAFGPVAKGVFWSSEDRQTLSYEVLLKAICPEDLNGSVSIADFGCGYGALFDLLSATPLMNNSRYIGFDISQKMIATAQAKHKDSRAEFITSPIMTEIVDYTFVSGTYNMYMAADRALWTHYIKVSLKMLWDKTQKALAFNLLDFETENKLDDLYYADKQEFIKFALTLTPEVEVIDGYKEMEFTLIVTKP